MMKLVFPASIFAIFLVFCMPSYAKDGFKSSEFLTWQKDNRDAYVRTTVGTAGAIAGQNDEKHAKCLENWYFGDEQKSNDAIYKAMQANDSYHPRLIILAVLQKRCGTFKYR